MKHVLNTFIVMIVLFPLTGCYTELATVEQNDRDYAYDADTTAGNGTTVINNNYYLDDSYRQSRLRVSFNYYYPTYSSWIGSYYNSYFNDYYWGMSYRPSWYYDPFYSYYPPYYGCGYPTPYYDPWYPYYPPVAYYPNYTPPIYGGTSGDPGRIREAGGTRDIQNDGRSRPLPGPSAAPVTSAAGSEQRPRVPDEATTTGRPGRTPERPWWEKNGSDTGTRNSGDARPVEVTKGGRAPREEAAPANPPVYTRPEPNREGRPIERNKPSTETGTKERQPESRPVERPRRGEVRNSTPAVSGGNTEARPVERPRESSRPSYTPAPQYTPPQSTPPRSSGGSNGGGGRKRD